MVRSGWRSGLIAVAGALSASAALADPAPAVKARAVRLSEAKIDFEVTSVERGPFISPNGKVMATVHSGGVRLRTLFDGRPMEMENAAECSCASFGSDSQTIIAGTTDGHVMLLKLSSDGAAYNAVRSVEVSPGVPITFVALGGTSVCGWRDEKGAGGAADMTAGRPLASIARVLTDNGRDDEHTMAFTPDGSRLLFVGGVKPDDPGALTVLNVRTGAAEGRMEILAGDRTPGWRLMPDGFVIAGAPVAGKPGQRRIAQWDLAAPGENEAGGRATIGDGAVADSGRVMDLWISADRRWLLESGSADPVRGPRVYDLSAPRAPGRRVTGAGAPLGVDGLSSIAFATAPNPGDAPVVLDCASGEVIANVPCLTGRALDRLGGTRIPQILVARWTIPAGKDGAKQAPTVGVLLLDQ